MKIFALFLISAMVLPDLAWAFNEHIVHLNARPSFGGRASNRDNSFAIITFVGTIVGFWLALSDFSPLERWMKKKGVIGFWLLILIFPVSLAFAADLLFYRLWDISNFGFLTATLLIAYVAYLRWSIKKIGNEDVERLTDRQAPSNHGEHPTKEPPKTNPTLKKAELYKPDNNPHRPKGAIPTQVADADLAAKKAAITDQKRFGLDEVRGKLKKRFSETQFRHFVRKALKNNDFCIKARRKHRRANKLDAMEVSEALLVELVTQRLNSGVELISDRPLEWFFLPDEVPLSSRDFEQLVSLLASESASNDKSDAHD